MKAVNANHKFSSIYETYIGLNEYYKVLQSITKENNRNKGHKLKYILFVVLIYVVVFHFRHLLFALVKTTCMCQEFLVI